MCFSATASFTAAGILGVIGSYTYKEAYGKQDYGKLHYFALIPLLFALQQFFEGVVWMTMPGHMDLSSSEDPFNLLHTLSVQGFLFFAGMFWPSWIPWVLYNLEKDPKRKKIIFVMLCMGMFVSLMAALSMLTFGNEAQVVFHNISYPFPATTKDNPLLPYVKIGYVIVLSLYVISVIGSSFVSSLKYVWIFGLTTLIGFIVAQIFYAHAFGSVWCFFAAIMSGLSYLIVRKAR